MDKFDIRDMFKEMSEQDKIESKYYGILADFSIALVDYRSKRGMTQEELAERLGVTQSIISRYENGTSNISLKQLNEVCYKLGIDLNIKFKEPDLSMRFLNLSDILKRAA